MSKAKKNVSKPKAAQAAQTALNEQDEARHIIHIELKASVYRRFVALKERLYEGVLVKDKPFAESLIVAGMTAREQEGVNIEKS